MSKDRSIRMTYFSGFIVIAVLLGVSLYLERVVGMNPCPLCILQRVSMIFLGLVFFCGIWSKQKWSQLLVGILAALTSLSGLIFSGRQVWIQLMPLNNLGECGVSFDYLMKIYPLVEVFKHVWRGGTECSQHGWVLLGLSLAEWSFIWFALFFAVIIIQLKRAISA